MTTLDTLRDHWFGVGTELVVRATRGICAGSLLNADLGRSDTAARIEDWSGVLSLYAEPVPPVRALHPEPAAGLRASA